MNSYPTIKKGQQSKKGNNQKRATKTEKNYKRSIMTRPCQNQRLYYYHDTVVSKD